MYVTKKKVKRGTKALKWNLKSKIDWSHYKDEESLPEQGEMEKREYCKITLNSSSFTEIESDAKKFGSSSLSTLGVD